MAVNGKPTVNEINNFVHMVNYMSIPMEGIEPTNQGILSSPALPIGIHRV